MNSLEDIKHVVDSHPIHQHPLLKKFDEGKLTKQQFTYWFEQQFYFSSSLAGVFAALYARIPDRFWKEKRPLAELIGVEAWGANGTNTHNAHFQELAKFLGLSIQNLTKKNPPTYTKEFIDERLRICLSDTNLSDGLAAIGLANEYVNLSLFQKFLNAARGQDLAGCPTKYFEIHLSDEEADYIIFSALFDLVASRKNKRQALYKAQVSVNSLLDARHEFFSTLHEVLNS